MPRSRGLRRRQRTPSSFPHCLFFSCREHNDPLVALPCSLTCSRTVWKSTAECSACLLVPPRTDVSYEYVNLFRSFVSTSYFPVKVYWSRVCVRCRIGVTSRRNRPPRAYPPTTSLLRPYPRVRGVRRGHLLTSHCNRYERIDNFHVWAALRVFLPSNVGSGHGSIPSSTRSTYQIDTASFDRIALRPI